VDRLRISEKLYGREPEIRALLAAFDRVMTEGTPELVLVSRYSGVWQDSVVNELHKVLVPAARAVRVREFDQYRARHPYATLAQGSSSSCVRS